MNQKCVELMNNREFGFQGEEKAAVFLERNGLTVLERNIRTSYGEIDILAQEAECLVFVEVKSRTSKKFGLPEQAVTVNKQEHMKNSALAYLQEHEKINCEWRIDVIAINVHKNAKYEIKWFKNAIFN